MTMFKLLFGLCAIAAISACSSSSDSADGSGGLGGGGGSGGTPPAAPSGPITFPNAPGTGNGPVTAGQLTDVAATVNAIAAGLSDGSLAAPTTAPAGSATLNGYVGIDGDGETETIIGNLTIAADFDNGTVATTADGFGEFDFANENKPVAINTLGISGGTLSGAGTITGTSMTSTLDGAITTTAGIVTIDADLNGGFFDNSGTLLGSGGVTGTATTALGTEALRNGAYAVSE